MIQYLKDGNNVIVTRDTIPSDVVTPEAFIKYVKEMLGKVFKNIAFDDASEIGVSDQGKYFLVYTHDVGDNNQNLIDFYSACGGCTGRLPGSR